MNLLTAEEVIDRLSECPQIRHLAVTCVLPAVWCADGWRFRERDLETWIAQHRNKASAAQTQHDAN